MSEDEAADYLDSFIANGGGQLMNDGTTGWYDAERGLIIIQKNDHSATAYSLAYEEFLKNLAGKG